MTDVSSAAHFPPPAKARPTFTLELRPEPGVDPVLALRALLKVTLVRFGLRCISVRSVRRLLLYFRPSGLASIWRNLLSKAP